MHCGANILKKEYIHHIAKKNANYYNRIVVGSLVSVTNPELLVHKENHKLRSKYKNRYQVIEKTNSSVLLQPCDEIAVEHCFNKKINTKEHPVLDHYRADLNNVKLLENNMILNTLTFCIKKVGSHIKQLRKYGKIRQFLRIF